MLKELLDRYPRLDICREEILRAEDAIISCYEKGGKLMLCGNGGSCADCEHIAGELMKGFHKKRPLSAEQRAYMKGNMPHITDTMLDKLQGGLTAIPLTAFTALNTAFCNDVEPALVYAQPLMAMGRQGDILVAISTSGNSANVYGAALTAKALGLTVIALTGAGGGRIGTVADITLAVPETETFKVQELHMPVYHYLCAKTEAHFFGE